MTPSQIITGFARSRKLPRQAIRAALERPDEVVPEFLRILTGLAGGERLSKDEEDAVFLIVHVLGEMRETRAFQPLMALLRRRRDLIDLLLGDAITVTLPDILISTFDGDAARLYEVMEDAEADEFVRDAVFKTWTYEVLAGAVDLEEAHSYLAEFPETHAPPKGSFVWTSWVDTVSALALEDLSGLVEKCFADQMIEDNAWPAPIMRLSDFQKDLTEAKANADNRLERFPHQPFDSTIGELSNWSGYAKSESGEDVASRLISDERDFLLREPATNPHRDVGRNDPCPCGSGKKYKKCCLVQ